MSALNAKTEGIILFVSTECEFCAQALKLVSEVSKIKISVYNTFPSRIKGKIEIRPNGEIIDGIPLLVTEDEIPTVPMIYDPVLNEKVKGVQDIEQYLIDCGFI